MGPGREAVAGAGRLQLRPGGARYPGGAGAAGRLRRPSPGAREGQGHRGGGPGVRRVPAAGRHARAGRAVGAAGHRPGDAGPAEGPPAGPVGGAGAVRPGREPGAGPVVEAGRRPLGQRGRTDRGPAGDDRRRLLPGDGLAAADPRAAGEAGLRPGLRGARPRGRPAVLRHDQHVLRDGGGRRPGRPRPAREPGPGRRRDSRRRGPGGGVPDLGQVQGPPRRPAPDRHRHGRHPRRHPAAGVVLAREHQRLCPDPPGQGRHAPLVPVPDRVGRRPRLHLRREPPLPAQGREPLHHRRTAPLRLRRGRGRPVPAGPLPGSRRRTCGSRKSASPRTSGSSSATTPRAPSGTPRSAPA